MNVYVNGAKGHIGKTLIERGCLPLFSDVRNIWEVERELQEKKPNIILHLAAKSRPDFCEMPENLRCVIDTNVGGVRNVLSVAEKMNIPVVVFSSDHVWTGSFWERTHRESDTPRLPVNTYGLSKMGAEFTAGVFDNAKIVRLSTGFDSVCLSPKFDAWERGEILNEPTFIRRSFIYLPDLVELIIQYANRFEEMPKVLHLAGNEVVSTFDFVYEVAKQYGYSMFVRPRWREVKGYAPRPHKGGLDVSLASSLGFRLPSFEDGIKRMKISEGKQ